MGALKPQRLLSAIFILGLLWMPASPGRYAQENITGTSVQSEVTQPYASHFWRGSIWSSKGDAVDSYFDDFSGYTPGAPPAGWLLRGTTNISPIIEEEGGVGPSYRLVSFPEVPWQYWELWLFKAGMVLSNAYMVTVKLNFQNEVADRAGLTIAWNDANWDGIDIQPNVYWDDIEFRVKYTGPIEPHLRITNIGRIPIAAYTDYWLRAIVRDYGPGYGEVDVYWSSDGAAFQKVVTATGLASVSGLAGISTAGPHMPHTHFDDFSIDRLPFMAVSQGAFDGWLLESGEHSSEGGILNATADTLHVGDNSQDRQYRSILSFDTSTLPDNAVITGVTLRIKREGVVGTNPFATHGKLLVDIRRGAFSGSANLQVKDFRARACKKAVMEFANDPVRGWYSKLMPSAGFDCIDKRGLTQFRLRFSKADNDDGGADYLRFYSGNALTASLRPQLIIDYYVP